jgi:hypothetical protein
MTRREPKPTEVLETTCRRGRGDRRLEPAASIAQSQEHRQIGAGLGQEVAPRDAEVRHAIPHELDDVVRPHEEDVDRHLLDPRDEGPCPILEDEARVAEQLEGGLLETPLVGHRQAEPPGLQDRAERRGRGGRRGGRQGLHELARERSGVDARSSASR